MPKVSVLMPIYNTKEEYLKEAIDSILKQTFTDFELLIVDDCPENTRENIILSYNDKRIKYYKNEKNLGISATRNKLIDMAKGEYLAVIDHDDIRLPESLAKEVDVLDNHPNIGVVGSNIHKMIADKDVKMPENNWEIRNALMMKCAVVHPSSMIRKSVLTKNHIYYETEYTPAEDYRLWSRLMEFTEFYNIQEVLFCYRDWKNNTTHAQSQKMDKAGFMISQENSIKYPLLWNLFNEFQAIHTRKIRLFGFVPFLKIVKKHNRTRVYLFEFILIFTFKDSVKG